jgi:hypothetical protein
MPIQKPVLQLAEEYKQKALDLDLPEIEVKSDGVSVEDARLRNMAGRTALNVLKGAESQPAWFARFEKMIEIGFPWRQAVYIAWASMPKDGRRPETQEQLAKQYLNLTSDRAISTWRNNNPAIRKMIEVMQSAELWEYRADWYNNLIKGMMKAGEDYKYFNHLKLYGEITGDYIPLQQLAAVLKNKPMNGAHEVNDDTLDELEAQADATEETINLLESGGEK